MDINKLSGRAPETHSGMEIVDVMIPRNLAIDAMQDVLDLANTTLTDEKYIIATRMSLDALKEVPQLRAQLAAVKAERDAARRALRLSIETHSVDPRQIERLARYYLKQASGPQVAGEEHHD